MADHPPCPLAVCLWGRLRDDLNIARKQAPTRLFAKRQAPTDKSNAVVSIAKMSTNLFANHHSRIAPFLLLSHLGHPCFCSGPERAGQDTDTLCMENAVPACTALPHIMACPSLFPHRSTRTCPSLGQGPRDNTNTTSLSENQSGK